VATIRKKNLLRLIIRGLFDVLFKYKANSTSCARPLHREEDIHPFFIVGSGRSGNTLLRRIINSHPKLFIPPETYVLGTMIRLYTLMPYISWKSLVNRLYDAFLNHPEFSTFNMNNLSQLKLDVINVDKKKRSLALIINKFYEEYRKQHAIKSCRWGDKTPLNTLFISNIATVFPNAKFIHIVRQPHDAIASYIKSGIYGDVDSAASRWVESVTTARKFGIENPTRFLEVKYEDLVIDPVNTIKLVCSFLNVKYQEDILNKFDDASELGDVAVLPHHKNVMLPIQKESIGKGKKYLSEMDIRRIDNILLQSSCPRVCDFLE